MSTVKDPEIEVSRRIDAEVTALQKLLFSLGALSPKIKDVKNIWSFALAIVVMAVCEAAIVWKPLGATYVNAISILLLSAIALWQEPVRKFMVSLTIIPATNIVLLSIPAGSLMVVVGEGLGLIGYGLLLHHYPYHGVPLLAVGVMSVIFAVAEEMAFRGLILQQAERIMPLWLAIVLTTALYTLSSLDHATILSPLFALLAGLVLTTIYAFRRNLVLTITANAAMKLTYLALVATFILR